VFEIELVQNIDSVVWSAKSIAFVGDGAKGAKGDDGISPC
jgi:hypothetical protein